MLTGWLLAVSAQASVTDSLFYRRFFGGTFGIIPNNPKSFKFMTVRLCHVAVIDTYGAEPFAHRKTAVQVSTIRRQHSHLLNRSLCVPVRASVNTSTSSSMR